MAGILPRRRATSGHSCGTVSPKAAAIASTVACWAAVTSLNEAMPTAPQPFRDHLADWRRRLPADQQATVDAIAAAFGETVPRE